jgi:hypothetical protein
MTTLPSPARCPRCGGHDKFTVHVRDRASGLNVCRPCVSDLATARTAPPQGRHPVRRGGVTSASLEVPLAPSRRPWRIY